VESRFALDLVEFFLRLPDGGRIEEAGVVVDRRRAG
jgi:hypothetical protein